jgi:hypothetical protein
LGGTAAGEDAVSCAAGRPLGVGLELAAGVGVVAVSRPVSRAVSSAASCRGEAAYDADCVPLMGSAPVPPSTATRVTPNDVLAAQIRP